MLLYGLDISLYCDKTQVIADEQDWRSTVPGSASKTFVKMQKIFGKLFSRPTPAATDPKQKQQNDSLGKRKIGDKNKKLESTKSNSSENLLSLRVTKKNSNSNSVENLDHEVADNDRLVKEKDSAVSLESVFSGENSETMEKRKTSIKKIPKSPSSSNLLSSKKDVEKMKSNKGSPIKPMVKKLPPEPKVNVNELKR